MLKQCLKACVDMRPGRKHLHLLQALQADALPVSSNHYDNTMGIIGHFTARQHQVSVQHWNCLDWDNLLFLSLACLLPDSLVGGDDQKIDLFFLVSNLCFLSGWRGGDIVLFWLLLCWHVDIVSDGQHSPHSSTHQEHSPHLNCQNNWICHRNFDNPFSSPDKLEGSSCLSEIFTDTLHLRRLNMKAVHFII